MKLSRARVREYRSVNDSNEFFLDDVTCLVGKNESGKTSILKALYKLNPIISEDGDFDITDDYPRRNVSDYEDDIESGEREHATVIEARFDLESEDIKLITSAFGNKVFTPGTPYVTLSKGYGNDRHFGGLELDTKAALQYLVQQYELVEATAASLSSASDAAQMLEVLAATEQTESVQELIKKLTPISEKGLRYIVYNDYLRDYVPKFLYFDDYYQMKGQDNIQALQQRVTNGQLEESDHPLLGLIELARLNLGKLMNPQRTEALLSKLEAAENQLTAKVLKYWSQNKHLRMKFDIRPGQPDDPHGMTSGTNIWGRVMDTKHMVSTPLRTRSRGFVWFFSFLAWYSQLKRKGERLILLLDEPGLSLHAKGQEDLLFYLDNELRAQHQVIYSTHSPFLVDATRFENVRIVQDLSVESSDGELPPEQEGTKVFTDILDASPDSLFPLQGALGYEINQSLFIGPNSLVVEGASDLLYLQTISALLQSKGEEGLDPKWVITPVGGSDKVSTFVALLGAQSNLNIAVLIDFQKKDRQSIENLYKKKILEKKSVNTYADFITAEEADVEDLFNPGFYLKLVNGEFGTSIAVADLTTTSSRIVVNLENYLEANPLPNPMRFNHFRPARYLVENITDLTSELTEPQLDRFRALFSKLNSLL